MTELREGEHVREYPNGWVVLSAEFLLFGLAHSLPESGKELDKKTKGKGK